MLSVYFFLCGALMAWGFVFVENESVKKITLFGAGVFIASGIWAAGGFSR